MENIIDAIETVNASGDASVRMVITVEKADGARPGTFQYVLNADFGDKTFHEVTFHQEGGIDEIFLECSCGADKAFVKDFSLVEALSWNFDHRVVEV